MGSSPQAASRSIMAAKGFWKLFGFKQKEAVVDDKENTPVETVVVENDGAVKVFREKKDSAGSYDSTSSLTTIIKRPLTRKKSQSEYCLQITYEDEGYGNLKSKVSKKQSFRFPAPICAAESAETMHAIDMSSNTKLNGDSLVSLPPHMAKLARHTVSIDSLKCSQKGQTCSTNSLQTVNTRSADDKYRQALKQQLRATQSCDLMAVDKLGKHEAVRKTMSATSSARIKEESNIMKNIKKREMVSAVKGKMDGKNSSLTRLASRRGIVGKSSVTNCKVGFNPNQSKTVLSENVNYEPVWKDSVFINECMDWHNLLQARHGVKQLQLDPQLCLMAQNWANLLAHTNEFYYQNPKEYGENLLLWPLPILPPSSMAMKCPDVNGKYVATYWYRSHATFPYQKDPDVLQSYASAFTQLVWAASQKFGCGKARSSSGKVVVVAYYYPKGNISNKYHLNVIQPAEVDGGEKY